MAVNDLMMQIRIAVLGDNGAVIRRLESQLKSLQNTANQLQNVRLAGLTSDLANLRLALGQARTLNLGTLPADLARFKAELLSSTTAGANFRNTIRGLIDANQAIRQLDIAPLSRQIQDINRGLANTKLTNLTPLQNTFRATTNEVLNSQIQIRKLTNLLNAMPPGFGGRAAIERRLKAETAQLNEYKNAVDQSRIAINSETTALANNALAQKQHINGLRQQIRGYEQSITANQQSVAQLKQQLLTEQQRATSARNNIGLTQAQITAEKEASRIRQETIRNAISSKEQEINSVRQSIAANAAQINSTKALLAQQRQLVTQSRAFEAIGSTVRGLGAAFGMLFGPQMAAIGILLTAAKLTESFVEANKQVETLVRGLNSISGGRGAQELEYLIGVSNKLGISVQESAHSFLQLEATTAGTAAEGKKTKQIFESFSRALNVTGADAVTFNRAFRSISQMLSKGQLYSEELKGQLAESLPGAIQVFAKAIEVTPKKFLEMTKAGQFAGQTLIDLLSLVSTQLDKTYKVGGEKDFTFVQKANLAKNAFLELSVALGNTGIWESTGNSILRLRDYLKSATDSIPAISYTLNAEWDLIKNLYKDGAVELVQSLSIIKEGWQEIGNAIPESIRNIDLSTLLNLPSTIKKAAIDSLAEIQVMALQVKSIIDTTFGEGASDNIDLGRGFQMEWDWFKGTIAAAGESAAAFTIWTQKLKEAKEARNNLMGDGFKFKPFTEDQLPFAKFLKSQYAIKIEADVEVSNDNIARFKRTLDYLKGLLAKTTNEDNRAKLSKSINYLEEQIHSEINLQNQLKDATVQANYQKWQILLKQNEDANRKSLEQARARNNADNTLQGKIDVVRQNAELAKKGVDLAQQKFEISLKDAKLLEESSKRENQRIGFYQSYNQQFIEASAAKERDIALTKSQLVYERKRLDLIQEQRDAQVGFAKARYQSWVDSGSMSQESANFLTRMAEQESARKAIHDAEDAVAAYNAEVAKGDNASTEELALLRERAIEVLKLGRERAKQTNNEYKYNGLIKEELRLRAEEKQKANEGAEAVYKAKIKVEGAKVNESLGEIQTLIDKAPKPTVDVMITPKLGASGVPQQDGLMKTAFNDLQASFQETQRIINTPLRIIIDDAQVNAVLQDLNQYQSKIQDIRTQSLVGGKTEIIITPKVNQASLQDSIYFIKTTTAKEMSEVPLVVTADTKQAQHEGAKVGNAVTTAAQDTLNKSPALKITTESSNYDLFSGIGKNIQPQIQKSMESSKATVKASVAEMNQDLIKKLGSGVSNGGLKNGLKIQIDPSFDQKSIQFLNDEVQRLTATDANLSFPVEFQSTATSWDALVAEGNRYMTLKPSMSISPETISATVAQVNQGLSDVRFMVDPATLSEEQQKIIQSLQKAGATGLQVFKETDGKITIYADNNPALETTNALINEINQRSATLKVFVQYIDNGRSGSSTTINRRWGGLIDGYGGGDRVHALLEPGEFVLRKEAVRKLGLSNVFDLNNLDIPKPSRSVDRVSIPSFSSGGYVGSSSVINIHVPNGKNIQVTGSRESATALANLLTRVSRSV